MNDVVRAAGLLRAGELVAFPTETVYGLGADAANPRAIARIFAAKGRPVDHPLIVHLPDASQLEHWAVDIPEAAHRLAAAFWPGPLTLILRRHPSVSDAITGGQDTVGLRVPNHPLALQLLREFGGGVAAPSANRFGRISPTTAAHVREDLGDAVALVLDGGPCAVGIESTILDLSGAAPRILRPGMLDAAAIGKVLGVVPAFGGTADAPRVSGSLEAHYAPRTPLQLAAATELAGVTTCALDAGQRVAVLAAQAPGIAHESLVWRAADLDPERFAHDLYTRLRELDALSCDLILVAAPPDDEAWRAVADRLRRAAATSK
ncbi:L-threonylcarbamoyladenylate synthase [Sulfuritalea sp.]|uniref:L-threonylcarbamoyladenylate synthase n=1 Tax=Sulfuritalea sp. TaxID=2480090 RepID=UPI001AC65437|nr:L-threonylcarbamoyladenylate synthase [Sulfuritalea sp.]MBN8475541.1 threonylcarbamoyl-AMP synthase [Sulfuritalea sp.]